jgi:Chalcone isomerase-like
MKKWFLLLLLLICCVTSAAAVSVHGITVEPSVKVGDELLQLNGYGMRKKFFFNIYLGTFYAAKKISNTDQVLELSGGKLIRMNFIYSKVQRLDVLGAFAEGFHNNYPSLVGSVEEKTFISWFKDDFVEGDVVDLAIERDGTVTAFHNFKPLGSLHSPELAKGILLIYFGTSPADENMKQGMLGQKS